jgi:hypothetical protein
MVGGLLQKAAMTSMPYTMAEQGMKYTEQYLGAYTPEQRKKMEDTLDRLRHLRAIRAKATQAVLQAVLPVHPVPIPAASSPSLHAPSWEKTRRVP